MASPAPLCGERTPLIGVRPRVPEGGRIGIGGRLWRPFFESNSLTVSRTRDFLELLAARLGFEPVVGLTPNGGLILSVGCLTGLLLPAAPSLASSRFGSDIGRGMRDFPLLWLLPPLALLNPGDDAVRLVASLSEFSSPAMQLVRQLKQLDWCSCWLM